VLVRPRIIARPESRATRSSSCRVFFVAHGKPSEMLDTVEAALDELTPVIKLCKKRDFYRRCAFGGMWECRANGFDQV